MNISAFQRSHFFVCRVRHLGLGDSVSHRGGTSRKTKTKTAKYLQWILGLSIFSQIKTKNYNTHIHFYSAIASRSGFTPPPKTRSGSPEVQIVAVKVLNPSKCLLKLYECSLRPDQNKTRWQVPVYDIPLFISESPQFPPTEREKTEREGGGGGGRGSAGGPEVCLGGRWLSVAVNRGLFWCHRLGTGLSVSQCNSYQRLTHSGDRRRGGEHEEIHTCSHLHLINFVKSGSVNCDGADGSHLALKQWACRCDVANLQRSFNKCL